MRVFGMNRRLLGGVGLHVALAAAGCSPGPNQGASSFESPPAASEPTASRHVPLRIDEVLDQWRAGHREEAIRLLLELNDSQAAASAYRPFDLSEEGFIAKPKAERDALQEEMLTELKALRELAREIDGKANRAAQAGDLGTSSRLLAALKLLGAANRGPEVPKLVGLVGEAIEQIADEGMYRWNITAPPSGSRE